MKRIRLKIYKSDTINRLIHFLFVLTIFLLPYDGVKIMPSVYKPICLIPALLLFILLLPKIFTTRLNIPSNLIILFAFLAVVSTFFCDFFILKSFNNFFDFFVTLALLVSSFISVSYIFGYLSKKYGRRKCTYLFFKMVSLAYILPLIITIVDALTIYGILPYAIKDIIRLVFGGNQPDRITGTSFECSWLAFHLMLATLANLYLYFSYKKKKYLAFSVISTVCFLLSLSMEGFMLLAILLLVLLLVNIRKIKFKYIIITALLLSAAIIALIVFVNSYEGDSYFIVRIKHFTNISNMFRNDLSAFVRIGYPILSLRMFIDHPLLGIGGSNFGNYLGEYINDYYPWALNFYGTTDNEVYKTVMSNSGTVKCLLTRVLCEFGVFGGFTFYAFVYYCLRNRRSGFFSKTLVVMSLVFLLQFDSLCFALFIIPMAYYSALPIKVKTINVSNVNHISKTKPA